MYHKRGINYTLSKKIKKMLNENTTSSQMHISYFLTYLHSGKFHDMGTFLNLCIRKAYIQFISP
jgi:hypothetical protein